MQTKQYIAQNNILKNFDKGFTPQQSIPLIQAFEQVAKLFMEQKIVNKEYLKEIKLLKRKMVEHLTEAKELDMDINKDLLIELSTKAAVEGLKHILEMVQDRVKTNFDEVQYSTKAEIEGLEYSTRAEFEDLKKLTIEGFETVKDIVHSLKASMKTEMQSISAHAQNEINSTHKSIQGIYDKINRSTLDEVELLKQQINKSQMEMKKQLKRNGLWIKLLMGVSITALTLSNPTVINFFKMVVM